MTRMGNSLRLLFVLLVCMLCSCVIVIWMLCGRDRREKQERTACRVELGLLDAAMEMWCVHHGIREGALFDTNVFWREGREYCGPGKWPPVCPAGGHYIVISTAGEPPICNVHGELMPKRGWRDY
jgi:hypothetical protein